VKLRVMREGVRIGLHGIRTLFTGSRRYKGNAEEICSQIVEECWDKELGIFITSKHSYPLFYARDFGMCVDSLLELGQRKRVSKTVKWALAHYKEGEKITQQINRHGKLFNFPEVESPDALAFFLHTIVALGEKKLVKQYADFLEKEIARFKTAVVDPATGLCYRRMHLGGMRDYAIRDSSCYDNVMLAAIKKYGTQLGIKTGLEKWNYQKLLIETFWTGNYFKDDHVNRELTGDANVLPFWFEVVPKKYFTSAFNEMQKRHLDKPVLLKYEPHKNSSVKMHWLDVISGGWERDTAWLHLGNLLLQVLAREKPEACQHQLRKHCELIEREQQYPEFLDKDGKPHHAILFHADDTMLWAANYLALSRLEGLPRQ
jgi:hypothetical protein